MPRRDGPVRAHAQPDVPVDRRASLRSAFVVGVSSLVGSLLPLAPFGLLSVSAGSWMSALVAVLTLFALGAYKARVTTGTPWKVGLELAAIGGASALVGSLAGALLHVPATP